MPPTVRYACPEPVEGLRTNGKCHQPFVLSVAKRSRRTPFQSNQTHPGVVGMGALVLALAAVVVVFLPSLRKVRA